MRNEEKIDFKQIIEQAMKDMGQVNILIAGKTGVGKSTLLNAVFGEDLAVTGIGHPVSQEVREYSKEDSMFHLFDTKGFELAEYEQLSNDVLNVIKTRKTTNVKDHIHIAWYCVNALGLRIEESEENFINKIAQEIPVVLVLTQTARAEAITFKQDIEKKFFNTQVQIIDVLAIPYKIDEDYTKKAYNVDKLVEKTYELIPEAAKKAFGAAQQVNKEVRKKTVTGIIVAATTAAIAAGATPIPFSDAIALAPIQIGMLARISKAYNLPLNDGFLSTLVSFAAGVSGATYLGRTIVAGILKSFPGIGSIVGGTISAATAGALTTAMGWAYSKALDLVLAKGGPITPEIISASFEEMMKKDDTKFE